MASATILEWTNARVLLKFDEYRDVKYQVYRQDKQHFLQVCNPDGAPVHTLELPDGMKLDQSSYQVLLRYVLLDVVAA